MDSGQDRLLQFDRDLLSGKNICSSEGIFVNFPPSLKKPFQMKGLGLVICRQGNFQFSLNQKKHFAEAGESLFINTGLKAVVDLFYFVTAVGCFCCPRSRRLDYNITNGTGCQHYFSSFFVFF